MEKNLLGYYGEQAALAFVRQERGYHVRCCNYRNRLGEIDIIADDGHTLVLVLYNDDNRWTDAPTILDYGFRRLQTGK